MSRRPVSLRRERGAAAVEMAVSLIVLVPVFLYALFLDDLLRYSMEVQEATVSTVWDFAVQDYSSKLARGYSSSRPPLGGDSMVQKQARLMFCDHESGIDSFKLESFPGDDGKPAMKYPDCEGTDHHKALVAHVCWINDNAKQVTCEDPEKNAGSLGDSLHGSFQGQFTNGGLFKCSAIAVVENYLLPKKFLNNGFSRVNLSKEQWQGAGKAIHDNSEKGTDDDAYFIKEQRLAILTDTWAGTRPENQRPGGTPPPVKNDENGQSVEQRHLLKEVEYLYKQADEYKTLQSESDSFLQQATQELLSSKVPPPGGDPKEPPVAISPVGEDEPTEKISQAGSSASYFNTEWKDWERDAVPDTYKARKTGYLGCKLGEGC
jgi:hypothetical protein